MKPQDKAAVLRAAAEHFDDGRMLSTGGAIWWVLGGCAAGKNIEIEKQFMALFALEGTRRGIFWDDDWGDNARECGTLALCLAAAMAETGDL